MRRLFISVLLLFTYFSGLGWGFYAHRLINYHAVFLLPPAMMPFFKANIDYLSEHAVDPDKRRYAVAGEAQKHYIDIDLYGTYPFDSLPRYYDAALKKYGDSIIQDRGIVPWHVYRMYRRLTEAFKSGNTEMILQYCAELGHYIADAHVPLHTSSNHNGQYTNQVGIHGLWETSIPELLSKQFDFFIGRAQYIEQPLEFIWERVLESAIAQDSVLLFEKTLSQNIPSHHRYNYEIRNGKTVRQYSATYVSAYDKMLNGMVERRMRMAIFSIASFWYSAWITAGQPQLPISKKKNYTVTKLALDSLDLKWRREIEEWDCH